MKKKVIFLFPVFCLLLLGIGLFSILKRSTPPAAKPIVLTTIAPYAGFLKELGQDSFEVVTLIPSNFDPHLFEPTPHDLLRVGGTTLWVRCGEPIEEKFDTVLPKATQRVDLPSSKNRSESHSCCNHSHDHEHHDHSHNTSNTDPHYWTSPKLLKEDVAKMAEALVVCFPEMKESILMKSEEIQKRLTTLDQAIRSTLLAKSDRAILVSHPSFGPFCDEYGIEQISLESEGKELSGRDILEKRNDISEHPDLLVVTQPQHPFQDLSHFAVSERPRYEVDPYSQNIEGALLHLAEQLADDSSK